MAYSFQSVVLTTEKVLHLILPKVSIYVTQNMLGNNNAYQLAKIRRVWLYNSKMRLNQIAATFIRSSDLRQQVA